MLMMLYEIFTIVVLLLAAVTGVIATCSLTERNKSYSIRKIFRRDMKLRHNMDFRKCILFAILTFSTAGALLAAFLRFTWLQDIGWENAGTEWGYWWLTSHALDGITFTAVHVLVYMRQKRITL